MKKKTKYILASASPRRKELLKIILPEFDIMVSDVEENTDKSSPAEIVMELSAIKASAVFDKCMEDGVIDGYDRLVVIGADTIVAYSGEILGKPIDEEDAKDMLSMLSDRTHQVYTGVSIVICENGESRKVTFSECTDVTFAMLDKYDIADYVASKDPLDKAGAYGIQGPFAKHVKSITGEYNNVVGLPICRLYEEMKKERLI